ncbi:MAG TPA: hypothetical protein ENI05_07250 [Porticoccus sp.]|nr:hypothetical protein [Porticoccus sp.]
MTHHVIAHSIAAQLKQVRSAPDSDGTQASGGPSLSTTLKVLSIPIGADWISITPRNYVGCGTVRVALTPRLTIVSTSDALATSGVHNKVEPTIWSTFPTQVISDEMQDGDAEDFAMDAFPAVNALNYIYVGASIPFRGAHIDVGSVNGDGSVLTVNYVKTSDTDTWASISKTDNTGGATSLANDGTVTWSLPTDWFRGSLVDIGATSIREPWSIAPLYWTRWEWSVTLDGDVDIRQIKALAATTQYAELLEGQSLETAVDTKLIANVEALTDAGSANVVINAGILDTSISGRKEEFRT